MEGQNKRTHKGVVATRLFHSQRSVVVQDISTDIKGARQRPYQEKAVCTRGNESIVKTGIVRLRTDTLEVAHELIKWSCMPPEQEWAVHRLLHKPVLLWHDGAHEAKAGIVPGRVHRKHWSGLRDANDGVC